MEGMSQLEQGAACRESGANGWRVEARVMLNLATVESKEQAKAIGQRSGDLASQKATDRSWRV